MKPTVKWEVLMKKTSLLALFFLLSIGSFGLFLNTTQLASPLIIPVTPDDAKPLAQAHKFLKHQLALSNNEDRPVIVEFKAGTYYAQTIEWTAFPKNHGITFRPEKGSEDQVIFDGRSSAEEATRESKGVVTTLFTFRPSQLGKNSSITVENLTVQYYLEGINFLGNRDDRNSFIGNTRVLNNSFLNIGNLHAELFDKGTLKKGLAVIRLVNSRGGTFKGNQFKNINNQSGSGQHAFYVAHYSESNLFEGNVFTNHSSGSVIKIRDQSHNNRIISNVFNGFWPHAIQVWHCDPNESMKSGKPRGFNLKGINNPTGCTKFNYDPVSKVYSNTESFSYGAEDRGNSFQQNGKQALAEERISLYQNPTAFGGGPDANRSILKSDGLNFSGVLISSQVGDQSKFGICSSAKDCVNSSNACFKNGSGSAHIMCENNAWLTCNRSNVSKTSGNKVCLFSQDKTDTTWVDVPITPIRTRPSLERERYR